ncbi:DUF6107 family protein [Pseudooceanicola sp.]|uniref:DUF6107 family protein n=1 Tax=Pseudooceanicola sp. TaxID=1914328 RepID=UPI004058BB75
MLDHHQITEAAIRGLGALIGVLASIILIAPDPTRNLAYRVMISLAMGFIFAPVLPHIPPFGFLGGAQLEFVMARGAAAGFGIWSVLEVIARLLSSTDWLVRLAREVIRLRTGAEGDEK